MTPEPTTTPIDRAGSSRPEPTPAEEPRAKLLELSLTQLIAGALAAATTAAVGSRLGVLGTIAGAAIGSFVSAVAASLYIGSLTRARDALTTVRTMQGGPRVIRRPLARPLERRNTRRLLATSGAVFAMAAAFLFGIQLTSGTNVTGTDVGTRYAQGAALRPDADTGQSEQRTLGEEAPEGGIRLDPSADTPTDVPTPAITATTGIDDAAPDPTTGTTDGPSDATTSTQPADSGARGTPVAPTPEPTTPASEQPATP